MMAKKVLRCADIVPGCDYRAEGETEDEVLNKAARHADEAHGIREIPPALMVKVKAAIRDEPR